MTFDLSTKIGTGVGTLVSIVVNIPTENILQTAVLACIGAAVSFLTTFALKLLVNRLKKKKD